MSKPTTAEMYAAHLLRRQEREKFDPGEIRLSEVGGCLRKASLRLLGKIGEKPDLTAESIFESGDEHEERIAALWEEQYPGGVVRQMEIPSPYGTGHGDIFVVPISHYVEAKSTQLKHRKRLPFWSHIEQVTLYLHYRLLSLKATAEIAYRFKETGEIVSFPVGYDPALADELVDRLRRLQDAKTMGLPLPIPDGASPDRFPCGWLREGVLQTCPYWSECWSVQGRTEDAAATRLLERYRVVEAKVQAGRAATSEAEEERDGVRAALGMVMDALGQSVVHHDGYEVRRSATGRWTPRAMKEGS